MSNGPEAAASRLAARITASLGNREWLDAFADRHGFDLEASPLPTPGLIVDVDPGTIALEQWPAVLATATGTVSMRQVDLTSEGGTEFLVTYQMELLMFVRGDDEAATDLLRKRYVLAAREALLAGVAIDGESIAPSSLTEDYSGQLTPQEGDVAAAARLSLRMKQHETIDGVAPYGTFEDLNLTGAPLT